ncbi:MAG: tRNA pseudouridine(55) synthase TruB [Streptococcaceae bacterium]|nr:tRNA pseudouridine(55) synthase TruB [Streptococcaceae bacterium]
MNGIINLYKEKGMTSHDCVFKLRKILKMKKIGHGGTLDPEVEGVLPICVGRGTKVIEYMVDSNKTYEGEMTFGFTTTTEDKTGEIVEMERLTVPIPDEEIKVAMQSFLGSQIQIPPMYSAVKVNGKRLYEYARSNQMVERPKRAIKIESFELIEPSVFADSLQRCSFRVTCSKGTYVRTLAVDLGKRLSVLSHMSELKRTQAAGLKINTAESLAVISEKFEAGDMSFLYPIELGVSSLACVEVTGEQLEAVRHGGKFPLAHLGLTAPPSAPIAVFYQEQLVAIYITHPVDSGILKPSKVLT